MGLHRTLTVISVEELSLHVPCHSQKQWQETLEMLCVRECVVEE